MSSFKVVIPARYASSRLPGKPIVDVDGRPLVQFAHERALESGADTVVIATDDERIKRACEGFGADVRMTRTQHASGTARIAEVVDLDGDADDTIVVNVQGDEPLIPPDVIAQVAANLHNNDAAVMATLCEPIEDDSVFNPSVVKVVFDANGFALYFSRAPIPWYRDAFAAAPGVRPPASQHYRHIGIYAYRAGFLRGYAQLPPPEVEAAEALEQLRALHHGARIHVARALAPTGIGVDTQEDLDELRRIVAKLS